MRLAALSTIALIAIACRDPRLQSAAGDIVFTEARVDLGQCWEGDALSREVTLRNRGRSPVELQWELPGEGFTFEALPQQLPSGDATFTVRFTSSTPGAKAVRLIARSGESHRAEVELLAEARAIPTCPTPVACHSVRFDKILGRCVETPLPDGTSCDAQSACVTDATCQAGHCVGNPVVCDDGNACTLNTCNALTGCEFPPAPPCPGDGKCQVGVCNPQTGCELAPAADGTTCGASTCDAAQVCINGSCEVRDPPDGYVCAEASPCQGQGICQGSLCARPPKVTLSPSWSFDSAAQEQPPMLHDFILEADGRVSLMGFFETPVLRADVAGAEALDTAARRCIAWNGQLACADFGFNGRVALVDLATGKPIWTFDLPTARPDFDAQSETLFMARVAAMGTDRLAALFEAYPKGTSSTTQCRDYYLVVLTAGGGMVAATKLTDPLLSQCNHPHPYGVASDTQGNLFLSFSPSANGSAPLAPQAPTLLISFTRDGVERWRRQEAYPGGELGVAKGLLYPEGSPMPHDAQTGAPVPAPNNEPRELLGRVVASQSHYVTSPMVSAFFPGTSLRGYFTTGQQAWTYALPQGDVFLSRELRAVRWRPRPSEPGRTAVLAFARRAGQGSLMALDLHSGEELWSCGLNAPIMDAPQLFEVAANSFTLMGGALTCGDCDPPFANSNAAFFKFEANGISPSEIPWSGTFGGPGHDHLENGFMTLMPQPN